MTGTGTAAESRGQLGVGVIGLGWMGHVHTRAYLRIRHHYPAIPLQPVLQVVADISPDRVATAVDQYGFARGTADWWDVINDPRVDAVSITAPNFEHREMALAAAAAGKHVWLEKPVGVSLADVEAVRAAAAGAGIQTTVGFNYRNAPAVEAARAHIAGGGLGVVTNAQVRLFSDYAAHPRGALSWRFERARSGSGVIGDLASHGVDLVRYLLGEIDSLVADTATFIRQRPRSDHPDTHFSLADGPLGDVENEDYVSALMRLSGGARVTLEANRASVTDQCNYGFVVHGTKGAVAWDFRRMGELALSVEGGYLNQSFQTVHVGPGDGEYGAFQPGAGVAMSFDDLKVIEASHFLRSVAEGTAHGATVDDAVASARALSAIEASVRAGRWVEVAR